jgi:hypothetical protein
MEPRNVILGCVAVFGVLLLSIWRPKTLAKGLIAILCITGLGLFLGYTFGDEELGFYFGMATTVIAGYGIIAVIASKVVTAAFKRNRKE